MAAFRKMFLALAVVVAVSSTVPLANAQLACTISPVVPTIRVEGLTEFIGDIVITCTGGQPTAAGSAVLTDNFEVDINSTNITSRLLGTNVLNAANGGYHYAEPLLIVNEAFPLTNLQNPTSIGTPAVPPDSYKITQNACPASNEGTCTNYGNGYGGWGDGTDAYSSYGKSNTYGGENLPYNVFQGYIYSNHAVRFDGIPVDPPGSGFNPDLNPDAVTPTIAFRITNIRIDATPWLSSLVAGTFGPPVYANLNVTGSQPLGFNPSSSTNNITVAYPNYTLKQVTQTTVSSLICEGCRPVDDDGAGLVDHIYRHPTFSYYAQENFASAFKAQTWYYDDDGTYTKVDPLIPTGAGPSHTKSTQDVTEFPYFTESDFFADGDTDLSGLIDIPEVGEATNGTRLVFTVGNLLPTETVTAPGVAGLYGGHVTGQTSIDAATIVPTTGSTGSAVAGSTISGIAILLGIVKPHGSVATDYSGSYYAFTPADLTSTAVSGLSDSIQFVYEIMFADGGSIETLWVPFQVNYCGVLAPVLPPPIATASVGLGPVGTANVPEVASTTSGDTMFPRFKVGGTNPLPTQQVWYLNACNCDLLFPYVASTSTGWDTGFAIANTSADPWNTPRSFGYVQFYYYLNSLVAPSFVSPNDAFGRPLLGNAGPLAPGPGSNVGPTGGSYNVYATGVYDPTHSINATASFQQITFNPVAPGDQFIALLSTGAYVNGSKDPGWAGTPGFEGYIFAVAGFPYCHGYAFISNGVTNQTQGYLALVVDEGDKLRRAASWSFIQNYGVYTTDPSWTTSATGPTGGTLEPILNPRDTDRNEYNN